MRELAVRQALPQKNWATQAMPTSTVAPSVPMASSMMRIGAVISDAGRGEVVEAGSDGEGDRQQQDVAGDARQPHRGGHALGPATAAFSVSSVMWAEASNPVIVYWASRQPMKNT